MPPTPDVLNEERLTKMMRVDNRSRAESTKEASREMEFERRIAPPLAPSRRTLTRRLMLIMRFSVFDG